jgi:predicted nuclease with TOPRIM domain
MDDSINSFLNKFAELERRVRKMAVRDRGLNEEVEILRRKLESAEAENSNLEKMLEDERKLCFQARDRLGGLIEKLESVNSDEAVEVLKAVSGGTELEL